MLNIYQQLPNYNPNEIFDIIANKIREHGPTHHHSATSTYSELEEVFVNNMANNNPKRFYQLSWNILQTPARNFFEEIMNRVTTKKSGKEKIVFDLHKIDHDQKFTLTLEIIRPFKIENISCTTNLPPLVSGLKNLFYRYREEEENNSTTFLPALLASNMDKINFMNSVFLLIYKLDPDCHGSNQFNLLQHICTHLTGYDKSLDNHRITMRIRDLLEDSESTVNLGDDIEKLIVKFSAARTPYQPKSLVNRLTRRTVHDILGPSLFGIALGLIAPIIRTLTDQGYAYSAILLTIALGCAMMGYNLVDKTETTNGHSCTQMTVGFISSVAAAFLAYQDQAQHDYVAECSSESLSEACLSPN